MNEIVFCDKPIRTDGKSWLIDHNGWVAVGIRLPDGNFDIIAYSNNKEHYGELHRIAREKDACYMVSPENGGLTAID